MPAVAEVGLVIRITHMDVLTALGERVLDVERLHRYYCEARVRVLGVTTRRVSVMSKMRPRIPVRLDFKFTRENADALPRALRQTLQIVASQKHSPPASDAGDSTWCTHRARLEIVVVIFAPLMEIDEKGLRYLLKLVELGVKVHSIPTICTAFDISRPLSDGHEALSFVEALQGLMAGIGRHDSRPDFQGVRKLTIADTTHSAYLLPILSAAQVSTSLHTVYVHIRQGEPAVCGHIGSHLVDLWRCVAYTLFSPDAEHNITRLELTLNHFRAEYVDAVRAVLWAWRPVSPGPLGAGVFDALLGHRSQRLTCFYSTRGAMIKQSSASLKSLQPICT